MRRRPHTMTQAVACAAFGSVFALLLTPAPAESSIVVILASRTSIVVGADSRRTTGGVVFHDVCKIKAGTQGIFAATGTYPDALLGRIWSAGEELANSKNTAEANLDALISMISAEEVVGEAVHKGTLAFVTWTPRGPSAASARFTTLNGRYHFERSTKDWKNQPNFIAGQLILSNVAPAFGQPDLLEFARNPRAFGVAERVIKLQAERDATVGGPTDLVRIDAGGVRWHRQKPECREKAHPQTAADPVTGMVLARVAPGSFTMGSPPGEAGREAQEAAHAARVARAFWIGTHEVTQAQWARVMGTNPSHFRGDERLPVENVTWFDVQVFLQRLSERAGTRYRLPTEVEWEYACRAGSADPYSSGGTLSTRDANIAADIEDSIAGRGATRTVGSFAPNALGLYDMHGNVWEWTADEHCPYATDGSAAPACGSGLKVIRGGSWYYEADSARCGLRYTHRPQDRGFSLGFRVVRED